MTGDPQIAELFRRAEELTRHLPAAEGGRGTGGSPVTCPTLVIDGELVRTVTTVLRFETATDVTTSELRVELMFPADQESDAVLRRACGAGEG